MRNMLIAAVEERYRDAGIFLLNLSCTLLLSIRVIGSILHISFSCKDPFHLFCTFLSSIKDILTDSATCFRCSVFKINSHISFFLLFFF